jgi:hypothetical protein
MRAFAAAWPEREIVQRVVAQLPWRQNIALLERLDDEKTRLWYAQQTLQHGWSQPILCLQIDGRAHARHGKALTNFKATLPPAVSAAEPPMGDSPFSSTDLPRIPRFSWTPTSRERLHMMGGPAR